MEGLYESLFPGETSLARELCTTAAVFLGTVLLIYTFMMFLRRKKQAGNLPPGLPSVPFLGSLPFMPRPGRSHIFFMEKAQKLGPVMTIYFPNEWISHFPNGWISHFPNVWSSYFPNGLAVVVNGREMIYEAFVRQSVTFASRPYFLSNVLMNPRRKGFLVHPYNSAFRRYHQLSLNILRKFGYGKGIMENRINFEVEDLVENIRKLNGEAICADQLVRKSVSNVIIGISFGERYDLSSPALAHLIEKLQEFILSSKYRMIVDFFPIMRFLPKYRRMMNDLFKIHGEMLKPLRSKIDLGEQGELPESFITHFIQMEGPEFDRDQLLFTLRDFFIAGTETTATILQWALIFLANHPDIQQRLYTEIDAVVSRNRLHSLDERKTLPFTEAVILEIMRIKTIGPIVPHETLDDTHLNGYFIPKGTMVLANLYSAHMDPTVWQDPHIFNPERFLDADGKVINKEAVIAFSLGKRSCLGELLGQQELFLFLTGLVQNFEIRPPEGQSTVVYKEFIGVTYSPFDYKVRLLPRYN